MADGTGRDGTGRKTTIRTPVGPQGAGRIEPLRGWSAQYLFFGGICWVGFIWEPVCWKLIGRTGGIAEQDCGENFE